MYRASGGCPGNCLMQLLASGVFSNNYRLSYITHTYEKLFKWPGFVGSSAGKDVFPQSVPRARGKKDR
eukprot:14195999-Heterocapsa_arctica.AAC.1